jgi:hypothetical protein
MIDRMAFSLLLMVAMAPYGGTVAEEASSPSYVLESSVVASSGGESSSPGYSVAGVAGQTVEPGFAEGVEFTADNGFLNDSDLDADGVGGSEDLCPTEFSSCFDLDHDGCIDLPDPDGDGDLVTVGACDCDDALGGSWKRPGEALSLRFPLTSGSSDLLEWDPPLDLGSSSVFYGILRSTDPADFTSPATACFQASTPDLTDFESPSAEPIFYYLIRARNLCPDGFGTLGTTANQVLRTGKDCYQ